MLEQVVFSYTHAKHRPMNMDPLKTYWVTGDDTENISSWRWDTEEIIDSFHETKSVRTETHIWQDMSNFSNKIEDNFMECMVFWMNTLRN